MRLTSSAERVPRHTAEPVNLRIQRQTEANISHFATNPERIADRLKELDDEWDIERAIEANAAALMFAGTLLGLVTRRKRWFFIPAFVSAFLFQHAIQGWCPPVPIMRRLGLRTSQEIEAERHALKALRGDFERIPHSENRVAAVLRAVGRFKVEPPHTVDGRNAS